MVSKPAIVTIPEGTLTAAFAIATDIVHGKKDKALEITATYNGVTVTATLTVAPRTSASAQPVATCASLALAPCLSATVSIVPTATNFEKSYNLYTPELNLLAETVPSSATTPPIAYEYVWFGGQPLAQIESTTGTISWYFNDHLGAPILQTDADARVAWRPEYEPYGAIYAFRRGEGKHQPLRLPGQENDGTSEISYNIFRWYQSGWGRYTQADPLGLANGPHLYSYAQSNPLRYGDPFGLATCVPNWSLANCGPGSACCTSKCIDALRVAKCHVDEIDPIFTVLGVLGSAGVGAGVGVQYGGPWGAICGAVGGALIGYIGLP